MSAEQRTILAIDDDPASLRLLDAVLSPRGYRVVAARSGDEGLRLVASEKPDLILCDVVMPGLSGYDVCRRLRDDPATRVLPIVMLTALREGDKVPAIEAGADDFLSKPFDQAELVARVRSLLRVKEYHDALAELNRTLEDRVQAQVREMERLSGLRRFVSPQLAEVLLSKGDEILESHRREITVVFTDLRNFTAFADSNEPEDVFGLLREHHAAMGELIFKYGGTLKDITGDGLMVFFNDPIPCPDPAERAVRMAVEMRDRTGAQFARWRRLGYEIGFGVGISIGHATLGRMGFEGRFDYGAVGRVVMVADRLCKQAKDGQILVSPRVQDAVDGVVETESVGELALKGFQRPVPVFNVVRLRS